jgi:hypothetical protein
MGGPVERVPQLQLQIAGLSGPVPRGLPWSAAPAEAILQVDDISAVLA